jgi:uncharacterized membrane protein HdeD (DUF308 family)
LPGRAPEVQPVIQAPLRPYKGTPWWQRCLAVVGLGGTSAFLGVAVALVLSSIVIGIFWLLSGAVK